MFDDLIKAMLIKDNSIEAQKKAKDLGYIGWKDILGGLTIAYKLQHYNVYSILANKLLKQLNCKTNLEFYLEVGYALKLHEMQKIPDDLKALTYMMISRFIIEPSALVAKEYHLLDIYLSSLITIGKVETKSFITNNLTSSDTLNNILIGNIEKYIIAHPDQVSFPEWIPELIGDKVNIDNNL